MGTGREGEREKRRGGRRMDEGRKGVMERGGKKETRNEREKGRE